MYLASPDNEWIGIRTELEDMAFNSVPNGLF